MLGSRLIRPISKRLSAMIEDDGDGQQGTESGAQHVDDVALGQVGKHDGDTGALRVHMLLVRCA